MIEKTRAVCTLRTPRRCFYLAPFLFQEVEAEYSVANGHSHNAEVIYGDTDSVMVRFGPTDLERVMAIGMQCPRFDSSTYP
jgi:DNA polymerase elongation subunit (family B)